MPLSFRYRVKVFVLSLVFGFVFPSCGKQPSAFQSEKRDSSDNKDGKKNPEFKLLNFSGEGVRYAIPQHVKVHSTLEKYNKTLQHIVYVEQNNQEPPVEFYIAKVRADKPGTIPEGRPGLAKTLNIWLHEAMANGLKHFHILPVPTNQYGRLKLTNSLLEGVYVDFFRDYAPNRLERLVYITDQKHGNQFYIRLKVNQEQNIPLSPTSLAGRVYTSILSTLSFKDSLK